MAPDKSGSKSDRPGIVKWVVLGVVVIIALFLFKEEIKQLLGRTESIDLPGGVKIKTASTVLGKAEVSAVTVKGSKSLGEGIQGSKFVSRQHKFEITWPGGGDWSASDTIGNFLKQQLGLPPTIDIPLVIMKNEMAGKFRPNVNVGVEAIGRMSFSEYFNSNIQVLQQQGWQILTKDFDEATQGGFLSFYNNSYGYNLYQFQRYAVANEKGYVITASQLPPEDSLSQQLRQQLLGILNSFRIIDDKKG